MRERESGRMEITKLDNWVIGEPRERTREGERSRKFHLPRSR